MKKTATILSFAVAAFAVQADQAINFNNNNLGTPRLVSFDSTFGALAGTGVKNGVADGASYVAQLFQVSGGSLTAIGATANFRAATTASPGTWSGGTRTLVGATQGAELTLQVRAWDSAFASYDAAKAAGKGAGESATFTFKDAMSSPPGAADNFMVNFQGFSITQGVIPEPSTVALGALGVAGLLFFRRK
jgi:hypothetical protein